MFANRCRNFVYARELDFVSNFAPFCSPFRMFRRAAALGFLRSLGRHHNARSRLTPPSRRALAAAPLLVGVVGGVGGFALLMARSECATDETLFDAAHKPLPRRLMRFLEFASVEYKGWPVCSRLLLIGPLAGRLQASSTCRRKICWTHSFSTLQEVSKRSRANAQ